MNRRQAEVQKAHIKREADVLNDIKKAYLEAQKDCQKKIAELSARADMNPSEIETLIYQYDYQEALSQQITGILEKLNSNNYDTVSQYLTDCYTDSWIGMYYDIFKQGIPLTVPIPQQQVYAATQLNPKLSKSMYQMLGENVDALKKATAQEVSRGIAAGKSWWQTAEDLGKHMRSPFEKSYSNACRIVRTEGHRVQQQAHLDAGRKAKENGADVLKQWDATLDDRTRETHQELDGQIREMDEDFEIDGLTAQAPGDFGVPEEDINCRCCMTTRARWALDEDELQKLEERAAYFGLDKTKDFEDFKTKYIDACDARNAEAQKNKDEIIKQLKAQGVYYNPPARTTETSTDEIVDRIAGGDKTMGSCSSLALAYCMNRAGYDVRDFRDGASLIMFATPDTTEKIAEMPSINGICEFGQPKKTTGRLENCNELGRRILKTLDKGKEYFFSCGSHAAIVKQEDDGWYYLELQNPNPSRNGYRFMGKTQGQLSDTFATRFGNKKQERKYLADCIVMEVDKVGNSPEMLELIGYINTKEGEEVKGEKGRIR